jgi:Uma2 family endonuclease
MEKFMSTFTLETRSRDSFNSHQPPPARAPESESFPYGWRYVTETLPSGEETYYQIPLTADDLLDPQLGDQVVQNSKHQRSNNELFDMLDNHYEGDATTEVFNDLKMIWKIPGLQEPAPDIAVVPNIKHKGRERSSFDVSKEGTRPCLIIEIMSEGYPGDDTKKVDIYERAAVTEYIIINPHTAAVQPYYEMWGYRLAATGRYQLIKSDNQGRLLSDTTNIWFSIEEDRQRLRLKDALTGQWLLTAKEERAGRLEAEAIAIEATKARLEAEARAQLLEQRLQKLLNATK